MDVYASTTLDNRGMLRFHRQQLPSHLLEYRGDVRVTHAPAAALTAGLLGELEPATMALRKKIVTVDSLTTLVGNWPLAGSTGALRRFYRSAAPVLPERCAG